MKKGVSIFIVIVVLVGFICIMLGNSYNSLVSKQEEVDDKYADISVQMQRRADLIPNLVGAVIGYMEHEKSVFEALSNARQKMFDSSSISEKVEADKEMTSAINNLYAVAENYPDLKADKNFLILQDELAGTENRISVARKDYNKAVKDYNNSIKKFPSNIVAKMFKFSKAEYFKSEEKANDAPEVSFK